MKAVLVALAAGAVALAGYYVIGGPVGAGIGGGVGAFLGSWLLAGV